MPARIKPDYKPSERVYQLLLTRFPELRTIERAREFVGHELDEFIMYWEGREDAGATKANWHLTCLNWMKRVYENKREKQHGSHQATQGDIFDPILEKIRKGFGGEGEVEIKRPPSKYIMPDPPKPGESMKPEEAFDQLRKQGVI